MKNVQILMSTYNGSRYISEQLDSILKQDYPNIAILIRDDGSTDNTVDIIKVYQKINSRIQYYQGNNIGVKDSFFNLIKNADSTMDYYALSDQDDVWKENKISMAISKLEGMSGPLLYSSETALVNRDLNPIKSQIRRPRIIPSFGNALVENVCTGCTCLFNNELLVLVKEHIPEYTVMHDWWLYLTASAFGKVVYDEKPYILYRQHEDNMIGTKTTYLDEFKKRMRNYRSNRGNISRQVAEFHKLYRVDQYNTRLLDIVISAKRDIRKKAEVLLSKEIYRQRSADNIIFKILFLFNQV